MKTIFTFGSSHLKWMKHKLNPMKVALVIEADSENEARNIVFESRIRERFSTSALTPNPAVHNVDNLFLEKAILKLLDSGWDAHPFSV